MDDALTLTFLFAALPADRGIAPKFTNKAKKLAAAWGAYCSTTCAICKSFISVKGVYMEALIQNVTVRWVIPHSFTQYLPADVDYRVMTTFFEFYETLLDFVLFKLYSDIGLRYPFPLKDMGREVVGSTSAILGGNLRSLTNVLQSTGSIRNVVADSVQNDAGTKTTPGTTSVEGKRENKKSLLKSVDEALKSIELEAGEDQDEEKDEVDVSAPLKVALDELAHERDRSIVPGSNVELDDDALKRKQLFQGLTFFLSREVPRGYLELVCLAYGGKVGWEGEHSLITADDPTITHHIFDRPKLPSSYDSLPKSREFVQPQWLLDCANFMFLLPIERYAVGCSLPPHLSPWVDDDEECYKPAYAEEIEKLKNGESIERDPKVDLYRTEEGDAEENFESRNVGEEGADAVKEPSGDESDENQVDEEDGDDEEEQKKRSLKKREEKQEKEAYELAKTMMSRKAAHLYGKMQYGLARKKEKIESLHRRRREIETEHKKNDSSGAKTVLKQKVERLKKERKDIEAKYDSSGGTTKKKRRTS